MDLWRQWRPDASVLEQRRPGALGPDRGFLDFQLAPGWRRWRLRQQGQGRFFADDSNGWSVDLDRY